MGGSVFEGDHWDEELLREGDRRNVVDGHCYQQMDAIIKRPDYAAMIFYVAIENWQHDLNIGTVVRALRMRCWRRRSILLAVCWNRRGAMVTDRYQRCASSSDDWRILWRYAAE